MNFVKALEIENNLTKTTNGAIAFKSTESSLLDFFANAATLRNKKDVEIITTFTKAFYENPLYALKTLFYTRDIRLGLGERRIFRVILRYLGHNYPNVIKNNIKNIAHYGRFDDLYLLVGTKSENFMWKFIEEQLEEDIINCRKKQSISLLAKWLKSINTSSKESRKLGLLTANNLGLKSKEYRKILSVLRRYINVVEKDMSSKQWSNINYENVPSKAMTNYRNAFAKNDEERFNSYIEAVKEGKSTINSSTLYPYEIIMKMFGGEDGDDNFLSFNRHLILDDVLQAQWNALPNYIEKEQNVLIMADTSDSMSGMPMATAIGLSIYFAERNKGLYKNKFLTFSSKPSFVKLKGNNLLEKIRCIPSIVENTNLIAAFDLILTTAISNKLSNEDLPKSLVIISDMQFDQGVNNLSIYNSLYDDMKIKFNEAGYEIPNIIFWNVSGNANTVQVKSNYKNTQLVSGHSTALFKYILNNIGLTPYDSMIKILNDERYAQVTL